MTKRFGPVVACDNVSLMVKQGQILGLLGQNGAGKTTLMRIVSGLVVPDVGDVVLHGTPLPLGNPTAAAAARIAMVHQHFSLVEPLTVWENIALCERGRIDARASAEHVRAIGARYGLSVDPSIRIEDLSVGERQRVEIIKCLLQDPRLIILDEPTSVLTAVESRRLFDVLRMLVREEGRAVVLISHKLKEILYATDEVAIMRAGQVVDRVPTAATGASALARAMLGRQVSLEAEEVAVGLGVEMGPGADGGGGSSGPRSPILELAGATVVSQDGRKVLDGLSLAVRRGEIVGVAGVEGNGQDALVGLLSDDVELASGHLCVDGVEVKAGHGHLRLGGRVGVIPADRQADGCVLGMSVAENLVLGAVPSVSRWGIISRRRLRESAMRLVSQFGITAASVDAPMWSLSGGNQQRVVVARELGKGPKVLVAAQPTHGLDVEGMQYMWARLREAAAAGSGVLLISSDLDEIFALADRIAVIYRGRIVGEMLRGAVDSERLGLMMGGQEA